MRRGSGRHRGAFHPAAIRHRPPGSERLGPAQSLLLAYPGFFKRLFGGKNPLPARQPALAALSGCPPQAGNRAEKMHPLRQMRSKMPGGRHPGGGSPHHRQKPVHLLHALPGPLPCRRQKAQPPDAGRCRHGAEKSLCRAQKQRDLPRTVKNRKGLAFSATMRNPAACRETACGFLACHPKQNPVSGQVHSRYVWYITCCGIGTRRKKSTRLNPVKANRKAKIIETSSCFIQRHLLKIF